MRQTRTRKLSVTMVITRASDPEPPPKATDNSSFAESEVSWSTSQYWASLQEEESVRRCQGAACFQFVSAVPVNEGRESQRDRNQVPKDLIADTRSVQINLNRDETLVTNMFYVYILNALPRRESHSIHDHATDLQNRHVCFLALVSLPHDGAHSLQTRVGAVQPGNVTLQERDPSKQSNPIMLKF